MALEYPAKSITHVRPGTSKPHQENSASLFALWCFPSSFQVRFQKVRPATFQQNCKGKSAMRNPNALQGAQDMKHEKLRTKFRGASYDGLCNTKCTSLIARGCACTIQSRFNQQRPQGLPVFTQSLYGPVQASASLPERCQPSLACS